MSTPATARGATIERYGRDRGYGAYAASDPGVAFARAGRQHNRINRLNGERLCLHPPQRTKAAHPHQSISRRSRPASRAPGLPVIMQSSAPPCRSSARNSDRKSVVQGKSVSVRVDLGGRRIIKKKTKVRQLCLPQTEY